MNPLKENIYFLIRYVPFIRTILQIKLFILVNRIPGSKTDRDTKQTIRQVVRPVLTDNTHRSKSFSNQMVSIRVTQFLYPSGYLSFLIFNGRNTFQGKERGRKIEANEFRSSSNYSRPIPFLFSYFFFPNELKVSKIEISHDPRYLSFAKKKQKFKLLYDRQ